MNICPMCGLDNRDAAKFCQNCGATLGVTQPQPAQGQTLSLSTVLRGHYLILKKLAAGGMGAVYLAQDTKLFNRLCVVKEMLPYYSTPDEKAEAEAKFEREARLLATLRHPGVPQVYDYFIGQNRYYVVMEFVDGDNLEEKLGKSGGRLPEPDVVEYASQVASVLAYISRQNPPVVHRDIKPANIIVDKNTNQVKLVDFGIAREEAPAAGPVQSSVLGTPGYSPPEQYSHRTEPRSDVFALGATMHHLLSGIDPREATRLFYYPPLSQTAPGISRDLEALINRMLDNDPANRPTAIEVRNELKKVGQPPGATPAGPFTFRGGAAVHDVLELAQQCDKNWDDGVYHLYHGHLEPWLQGLNRHDLASRAGTIRKRGGDANAGLEEFLRAVNPTVPLPVLTARPSQLNFGLVEKGDKPKVTLEIENAGRGYLHGEAKPLVPWARVTPARFGCKQGERTTLNVELDTSQLAEGNIGERLLTLDSNGGQAIVCGQFLVTWPPKLMVDAVRLDLGDLMEENLGQRPTTQFTITNVGGGLLEGQLDCTSTWLSMGSRDFRLLSGQSMTVQLLADTGQLAMARSETAEISVTSSGGSRVLSARIGVIKKVYKQRTSLWGVYGALLLFGILGWAVAAAFAVRLLFGLERNLPIAAGWLAGGLAASGIALFISRRPVSLLDEIENFYHASDLAGEIPARDFDIKRLAMLVVGLALVGLLLGLSYATRFRSAAWWPIPLGTLAGASLGALFTLGASGSATWFGSARPLLTGLTMACFGTLATTTRTVSTISSPPWTVMVWAVIGMILAAEASRQLPVRLSWLLARVRTGLLCALLAYFGWLAGLALIYRMTPSVTAFYSGFPVLDFGTAFRNLLVIALTVGSMALGLWADNAVGVDRRRTARTMLWALIPGSIVAIAGFVVGYIVFSGIGLMAAWSWGVLATVLAFELAVGWLAKFQSARLSKALGSVRRAANSALSKVNLPPSMTNMWVRVRTRLPGGPTGGWLSGLTLTAGVGVAGTLILLAPLATQVVFSLLLVLGGLAVVAVIVGAIVWYVRKR
jgi:serine/threonine protein kinase